MLADILGHEFQKEILARSAAEASVAHAYLFSGPEGTGKKLIATEFAKLLNCVADDSNSKTKGEDCACGSCTKITKNIHPDVVFVEFEGVKNIKVEQIREDVEDKLYLKPFEGKYKIVIVDEAERLSNGAQNAFLKTLEEPPSDSVIILITSVPNALLPTIRSRCQVFQFNPLPEEIILEYLAEYTDMSPEDAAIAAKICDGSLGQALRLNYESIELRKEFILELINLRPNSASRIAALTEALPLGNSQEESESLKLAFKFMSLWLRDLALIKIGYDDNALSHIDLTDRSKEIAQKWTIGDILEKQKFVENTWYDITRANANKQLALENLFMKLAEN